jgi:hypothetical protein
MPARLIVAASRAQVETILASGLNPEELSAIRIAAAPLDPFAQEPHRDLPSFQTVLEFVAASVASGITYDVLKKAAIVLRDKLGANKVREVEKAPETPTTAAPPISKADVGDGGE